MSSISLLPDNATPLEMALERTIAKMLGDIPSPFPSLWRPDDVSPTHLPWLADALGVTEWDASAPDAEKRETVKNYWGNQRQAGMRVALRRAVEPLGFGVYVAPWYESGGEPYHFKVELTLLNNLLDADLLDRAGRRIEESKSERDDLSVAVVIDGSEIEPSVYARVVYTDMVVAQSLPHPNVIESRSL
jgi:phage tail P2-like protein